MREETTSSGYDQPRTDPIPPQGGPEPIAQPGPAGAPPAGPEPASPDRPEPDLPESSVDPVPAGHADMAPVSANPVDAPVASGSDRAGADTGAVLFGRDEVEGFRLRWRDLQADFVDDPARAVQGADQLVDEVLRALAEVFAAHKRELEDQWGGGAGGTEELRMALRGYRSFFDRLLDT
jgi:hypothetical protein